MEETATLTPVSDTLRNQVWTQLVEVDRLSRYYNAVASRMASSSRWRLIALAASAALGASIAMIPALPSWYAIAANALVVFLSIWLIFDNYAHKLAVVRVVCDQLSDMQSRTKRIWVDVEDMSKPSEDITARWAELNVIFNSVVAKARNASIPIDEDLRDSCEKQSNELVPEDNNLVSSRSVPSLPA